MSFSFSLKCRKHKTIWRSFESLDFMLVGGNREEKRCYPGLISHFISHFKWFYIFRIYKGFFSLAAGKIHKMDMLTWCVDSNWDEKYILYPNENSNLFPKWIQMCIRTQIQYIFFHSIEINHIAGICPGIHWVLHPNLVE